MPPRRRYKSKKTTRRVSKKVINVSRHVNSLIRAVLASKSAFPKRRKSRARR